MENSLLAILAAAGSFFVIMVASAILFALCRRRRPKLQNPHARTHTRPPGLSSISITESAAFDPSIDQVSMSELIKATKNFSPDLIIGDGSFGLVYKARLSKGVTVAVKKLSSDAFQGFREFRAEMETLSKLCHRNIVRILGYCATGLDRVLIYEFVEKGSLDQWLLDSSSSETDLDGSMMASGPRLPLSWETRIKIVRGVANGLAYMHTLETPIIHRDIKASNVLLDKEFEPHIADFGLARRIEGSHSHVSTQVAGTMGYMPPEYIQGATMATAAGDVYSFGILMLEISTGIRPNLPFKDVEGDGKEMSLVEWARKMVERNRHMEILDHNVSRDGLKESGVKEFFRITNMCTSETSNDRPVMTEVVELLNWISA